MNPAHSTIFGYLRLTNFSPDQWQAVVTDQKQIIGRSKEVQIVVPREFGAVSRQHATVWGDKKGCWICDVGSTFGVKVNGLRITPNQPSIMQLGDKLRLADVEFLFLAAADINKDVAKRQPDSSAPTRILEIPDRKTEPPMMSISQLTDAELKIAMHLRRGIVTLEELAAVLHRSPNTVRKQLESIYKKMNVHSRHELVAMLMSEQA